MLRGCSVRYRFACKPQFHALSRLSSLFFIIFSSITLMSGVTHSSKDVVSRMIRRLLYIALSYDVPTQLGEESCQRGLWPPL